MKNERQQLAAVKRNGRLIYRIPNPSEKVQMAADYRLDNFHYPVIVQSEKEITIGCTTLSLKEWLRYKSSFPSFINEKLKELILKELEGKNHGA